MQVSDIHHCMRDSNIDEAEVREVQTKRSSFGLELMRIGIQVVSFVIV